MDEKLRRAVTDFKQFRKNNPSDEVDLKVRFQRFIVERGVSTDDQDALADAALEVGVPRKDLDIFMDELASWLS